MSTLNNLDTVLAMRKELALGTYVVIRIDPVASCAGAKDPELTALAKRLPSKKYLAVITDYTFMPKPQWGVKIVSQGFPSPDKNYGIHEGMCTPIFPTTYHPEGREALRANKEFPWTNCYHHSLPGDESLAVSSISREGASDIQLPKEEVSRLFRCFLTDSYAAREAKARDRDLLRQAEPQPVDNHEDDQFAVHPSESCDDLALPSPPSPALPAARPSTEPISHEISSLTADPNEGDEVEPYEDFSDITSISGCTDENEGLIRALESCLDPSCIIPTMDVWLDLGVFDSQTLPPVADFWAEVQEITNLYFKWKAKQEVRVVVLQKQKEKSAASRSSTAHATLAPKTDKTLGGTRLKTIASRVCNTVKSFKLAFRRLLPCGRHPISKEA